MPLTRPSTHVTVHGRALVPTVQFGMCGCLVAKEMDEGFVATMIVTRKKMSHARVHTKMLDIPNRASQDASALYYLCANRKEGRPFSRSPIVGGVPSTRAKMRAREKKILRPH